LALKHKAVRADRDERIVQGMDMQGIFYWDY